MADNTQFATREQLLALAGTRQFKEVDTEIGKVRLRTLIGTESFEIDNYAFDSNGKYERAREKYARAKRIVETVVNEKGQPIFTDLDLEAISKWPEPLTNALAVEIVNMAKPESLGLFAKNE